MRAVYGETLGAFAEQFDDFPYFDMAALQGSGFGPRTDVRTVRGVYQCTGGRMVRASNGNLIRTRSTRFWTRETLEAGRFLEAEGDVLRIGMPDNEWAKEGGFNVYDLQKVVGADGTERVEPAFDTGERSFG